MTKLHIKKGDTVYVNSGNDRGKQGRVLSVLVSKQRAIVEGVNIVTNALIRFPLTSNAQGERIAHEFVRIETTNAIAVGDGG